MVVASVDGQRESSVRLSQNTCMQNEVEKSVVLIRPDYNNNDSIYHPFLVVCQYSNPRRQEKTI